MVQQPNGQPTVYSAKLRVRFFQRPTSRLGASTGRLGQIAILKKFACFFRLPAGCQTGAKRPFCQFPILGIDRPAVYKMAG
jgi:hypothetical protein